MGRKSGQKQRKPVTSLEELRERAFKAQREGRFKQCLELARSLYKQDPSAANVQLCQRASLERARQLRSQGSIKDAITVLGNCVDMGGDQGFLEQVALELAACGEGARAQKVLERCPDSAVTAKVLAQAVDAALRLGAAGRMQVPEPLRPQFDLVVQAFAQMGANQDEAARSTLQGIGLSSPFLEWKLLVRGLLAYYQGEDARAAENWQRLDSQRLPSRLAAPFRVHVDAAFRQAQTPEMQNRLQKALSLVQASALDTGLRRLQTALASSEGLGPAFRQAESILPALRQQAPPLVPRLAHCFYWAIVHHGLPKDMDRYFRLFGKPADDPNLTRLQALVLEKQGDWDHANKAWKDYEQELIDSTHWQAEQKDLARALLWKRMGDNAVCHEHTDVDDDFEGFPFAPRRRRPQRRQAPKPSAETCFRRSLELNPKRLETHQALAGYLLTNERLPEAEQAGRALLIHFPQDVETMQILATLCHARKEFGEGLRLLEMALQVNPLDRELRGRASTTHVMVARSHAEEGRFEDARRHFALALELDRGHAASVYAKWAACEFKAKNSGRAEELLRQAQALASHPAPWSLQMVIEAVRLQLPAALKKRFERDWQATLAAPPTPAAVAGMLDCLAVHHMAGISYTGQQAHKKRVIGYFENVPADQFSQDEASSVCEHLLVLNAAKQAKSFALRCQKRFPAHPSFVLAELQVMLDSKRPPSPVYVLRMLRRARELAEAWPDKDSRAAYLNVVKRYEETLMEASPLGAMAGVFGDLFERLDDFLDLEEDDD